MWEEYWPRREQIANILFDSVLQANALEITPFFSALTSFDLKELQFINLNTKNNVLKYSGQPDTVLLDEIGKTIIVIEIKIGAKAAKYMLDQHLKILDLMC